MGCLDVKDAFLQVEQPNPILVSLQNQPCVILRNLPGQRMGARQWFQHLREHFRDASDFEFCSEQPCLAKNQHATILIHVDDIMFVGKKSFWENTFLKGMSEKFSVSHSQLNGLGTSVTFWKRKITEMDGWLMLTPGTSVEKVVKAFESAFGVARKQKVPCDSSIQLPDGSEKLNSQDCSSYRSIIGLCLYVSRERPDLMFTIKELASSMSTPTLTSVQPLRKLVGYMKHVGDLALRLDVPMPGQGKCFSDGGATWILESYSDADWYSNKDHRRSTSCGMHYLKQCVCLWQQQKPKNHIPFILRTRAA